MNSRRLFLSISLFLVLTASVALPIPSVHGATVNIYLSRTVYGVGEPVAIQLRVDGGGGSGRLIFNTPAGTINYDISGIISPGIWYTVTVYGVTMMPGSYAVRAQVFVGGIWWTSATRTFAVVSGPGYGFDFSLVLSPAAQTVEQGGTATFRILVTYSSPVFSGTSVSFEVTGLGPGMDWRSTYSGDLFISTSHSTPAGTYTIVVIGAARGVVHQTSAVLTVTSRAPPFDFTVSVTPLTQTVNIGDKVSFSVTVNLVSGSAATTSLTLSGLPSGLNYSFSPQSAIPSFTSVLTIDASGASSTGTYSFTITASGGGLSKTVNAGITVKEAPDFTMSVSPNAATAKQGEKVIFNIAVNPTAGGFDKVVTLDVAGLPTGASAIFSVPSGKPPLLSTLTITLSPSTPEGSYSLAIGATGDAKIHSTRVTLNVERKPTLIEQMFGPEIAPLVIPAVLVTIVVAVILVVIGLVFRRRAGRVERSKLPFPSRLFRLPVLDLSHVCPRLSLCSLGLFSLQDPYP